MIYFKHSVLLVFAFICNLEAQNIISGKVTDANGQPLSNVTITVLSNNSFVKTNDAGEYSIPHLANGKYIISFKRFSFAPIVKEIELTSQDLILNATLFESPFEISSITVTAEAQPSIIAESPTSVSVISGKTLDRLRGQSVGETIGELPGVNGFSGSPFAMKPVIRGLIAQRVIVMQDGKKVESQVWDEPQSPEIDGFDIDQIDVVRGPISVLYGSDAIGGVVNVTRKNVFSLNPITLGGDATINFFSNSTHTAGAISLYGIENEFAYRANFSGRYVGDYSAPSGTLANGKLFSGGTVFNSGGYEYNGSATAAMKKEWGTLQLDFTHFGQKYYISPEPGRKEYELNIHTMTYDSLPAAPSQEIFHERIFLTAQLPTSLARVELSGGFQYNSRKEDGVKETDADEQLKKAKGIRPEALLDLYTFQFDAKAHHKSFGPVSGTIGISLMSQRNQTLGVNAIIPNSTARNVGGYIYEELTATEQLRFIGGVRYDSRSMEISANDSLKNLQQSLTYNSLNGTGGVSYRIIEPLTFAVSIGSGWRAPVASELYTRGKDEGAIRYKLGNPALTPEHSFNIDLSLRYSSEIIHAEISAFKNSISDYIYLVPTGATINSLNVYSYQQSNATLTGGEVSIEMSLAKWLIISGGSDRVDGTNKKTNSPLPLIPAQRIYGGIRCKGTNEYQLSNSLMLHNTFVDLKTKYTFEQNKPGTFETKTPAYTLIDIGTGGEFILNSTIIDLNLIVENIFDIAYYDHLSRYKEIALNPGRNFVLKASFPFTILQ